MAGKLWGSDEQTTTDCECVRAFVLVQNSTKNSVVIVPSIERDVRLYGSVKY